MRDERIGRHSKIQDPSMSLHSHLAVHLFKLSNMIDSILPFVLAHALLGYGLAYLSPASPLRLLSLLLITLCCLTSVQSTFSQRVPGLIGNEYIIGFILHASNFLVIELLSSQSVFADLICPEHRPALPTPACSGQAPTAMGSQSAVRCALGREVHSAL